MIETMKLVLDTFGSMVFVPIMLFVVALILKTPVKKAFMSALLAGVGLCLSLIHIWIQFSRKHMTLIFR